MQSEDINLPWVSFCMSTYKRPNLLKQQLESLLKQTFSRFEIIISDNDPLCSGEVIVESLKDERLKYYSNFDNLGMIKSYNKSIERATSQYIIMITDDDPVANDMVQSFHQIINNYPGYSVYIGCERIGKTEMQLEVFDKNNFVFQILHPKFTCNILWSSCVLKKRDLLKIGGMPDYGSPHLADHAMMALCGSINGGVIINKMYSTLTSHDNNFSKSNLVLYFNACNGFYKLITIKILHDQYINYGDNALIKHLERWFIVAVFSLRKYFTYNNHQQSILRQLNIESNNILRLPFMKHLWLKYYIKLFVFNLKRPLYFLKVLQ